MTGSTIRSGGDPAIGGSGPPKVDVAIRPTGMVAATTLGQPAINIGANKTMSPTGMAATVSLGTPTLTIIPNPWDPPTPDTTVNIAFSQAALETAISNAVVDQITKIVLPSGTSSAAWNRTTSIEIGGKRIIIDHQSKTWNAADTATYAFNGTYSWTAEVRAVQTVGGKTQVTKDTGVWADLSPAPTAGQIGKIFCNAPYRGDISNLRRHGEDMVIESVSGATMTFTTRLLYNEDTSTDLVGTCGVPWADANRPFFAMATPNTGLWLIDPRVIGPTGSLASVRRIDIRTFKQGSVVRSVAGQAGTHIGSMIDCYGMYWIDPSHNNANGGGLGAGLVIQHSKNCTAKRVSVANPLMNDVESIGNDTAFNPSAASSQTATVSQVNGFGFSINARWEGINLNPAIANGKVMSGHSGSSGDTYYDCWGTADTLSSRPAITIRGKGRVIDGSGPKSTQKIVAPGGVQFLCYPADRTTWGGSGNACGKPSYYAYRDASDCIIRNVWIRVTGGGSGAIFMNNTGSQADNADAIFNNELIENVTWELQGGSSCNFKLTPCGTMTFKGGTGGIVYVNSAVGTVFAIDRPVGVVGNSLSDITFDSGTPYIIDLAGHPASGTVTLVNATATTKVSGILQYRNVPAGLTVVPLSSSGGADVAGLTIQAI